MMNEKHKEALMKVTQVIKNMPRDKFNEKLKEHENGDIAYALNGAIDYEKKYNDLVNSIKYNIEYYTGGDERKSMRETFRDEYIVSVLIKILEKNDVK